MERLPTREHKYDGQEPVPTFDEYLKVSMHGRACTAPVCRYTHASIAVQLTLVQLSAVVSHRKVSVHVARIRACMLHGCLSIDAHN